MSHRLSLVGTTDHDGVQRILVVHHGPVLRQALLDLQQRPHWVCGSLAGHTTKGRCATQLLSGVVRGALTAQIDWCKGDGSLLMATEQCRSCSLSRWPSPHLPKRHGSCLLS